MRQKLEEEIFVPGSNELKPRKRTVGLAARFFDSSEETPQQAAGKETEQDRATRGLGARESVLFSPENYAHREEVETRLLQGAQEAHVAKMRAFLESSGPVVPVSASGSLGGALGKGGAAQSGLGFEPTRIKTVFQGEKRAFGEKGGRNVFKD